MTMKKPDPVCIIIALFAFLHVYLLSHDNAGVFLQHFKSPRVEILCALGWFGGYFGTRAWVRSFGNDDVPAASILLTLGVGSSMLRSFL